MSDCKDCTDLWDYDATCYKCVDSLECDIAFWKEKAQIAEKNVRKLREALNAARIPTPPIETYPKDIFAESYRDWYHGLRCEALIPAKLEK